MPQDVTVVEGEKLMLECVVRGTPLPNVSWTFGKYPSIHLKSDSMAVCHLVKLAHLV